MYLTETVKTQQVLARHARLHRTCQSHACQHQKHHNSITCLHTYWLRAPEQCGRATLFS